MPRWTLPPPKCTLTYTLIPPLPHTHYGSPPSPLLPTTLCCSDTKVTIGHVGCLERAEPCLVPCFHCPLSFLNFKSSRVSPTCAISVTRLLAGNAQDTVSLGRQQLFVHRGHVTNSFSRSRLGRRGGKTKKRHLDQEHRCQDGSPGCYPGTL